MRVKQDDDGGEQGSGKRHHGWAKAALQSYCRVSLMCAIAAEDRRVGRDDMS